MPEPLGKTEFLLRRREMRRYVAILFIVTCVFLTLLHWKEEHDSCARQGAPRAVAVAKFMLDAGRAEAIARSEHGRERAVNTHYAQVYRRLASLETPLSCGGAFPEVGDDHEGEVEKILAEARNWKP